MSAEPTQVEPETWANVIPENAGIHSAANVWMPFSQSSWYYNTQTGMKFQNHVLSSAQDADLSELSTSGSRASKSEAITPA